MDKTTAPHPVICHARVDRTAQTPDPSMPAADPGPDTAETGQQANTGREAPRKAGKTDCVPNDTSELAEAVGGHITPGDTPNELAGTEKDGSDGALVTPGKTSELAGIGGEHVSAGDTCELPGIGGEHVSAGDTCELPGIGGEHVSAGDTCELKGSGGVHVPTGDTSELVGTGGVHVRTGDTSELAGTGGVHVRTGDTSELAETAGVHVRTGDTYELSGTLHVSAGVLNSSVELDERVAVYCQRLAALGSLWRQLAALGLAQGQIVRRVDVVLCTLDRAARQLLERTAQVESKRQTVLQLTDNVAVSGHAVEARALELADTERDSEYREQQQARQVIAIHRLTVERRELERRVQPKMAALKHVLEVLADKEERLRRLQHVQAVVTEHCVQDMVWLEQEARDAQQMAPCWRERGDKLDIQQQLERLWVEEDVMSDLQQEVHELKNQLHHLQTWGGEALQTKLLYCSRSRQIKQRSQLVQHVLASRTLIMPRDSELQGMEDTPDLPSGGQDPALSDSQRAADLLLADGAPYITASQVEQYLGQQFGFEVQGHYLMYCRLRAELGGAGLAYLAHKVRDGGSLRKDAANPRLVSVFQDPSELRRVLLVLQDIAFQFRADPSVSESVLVPLTLQPPSPSHSPTLPLTLITQLPKHQSKRAKGQSLSKGPTRGQERRQTSLASQQTTPTSSKVKVDARSSLSRLKRAFGLMQKKSSQHANST